MADESKAEKEEKKGDDQPSWVNQLLNKLDSLSEQLKEQDENKPQQVKVPEPLPPTPQEQEQEQPQVVEVPQEKEQPKKKSFLDWLM